MAEKILNARFAQKYDTLTAWASSNIVLKAGEIAFATESIDTTVDGVAIKQPIVLAKIGDGSKTFSQLPYSFYAKASDVHAWAKAAKAPDELDTKYSFALVDGKLQITETTYTDGVAGAPNVLPLIDVATQEELNAVEAALNTKIGDLTTLSTEKKTNLVEAINEVRQAVEVGGTGSVVSVGKAHDDANKQTTYTVKQGGNDVAEAIIVPDAYDDTSLAAKVAANETAIANETTRATGAEELLGERLTATEGVANSAKSAIDAFLNENAVSDNVVNTLKEIQEGLDAGEESAASLLAEINKLKDGTTPAGKATADAAGNVITETYATKTALEEEVNKIVAGTTVAGKAMYATYDQKGSVIDETYATKEDMNSLGVEVTSMSGVIRGYGDIVTHNVAEFATAAQGAKANSAIQSVTSVAGNGITATTTNNAVVIDWDSTITFVFDAGDSGV